MKSWLRVRLHLKSLNVRLSSGTERLLVIPGSRFMRHPLSFTVPGGSRAYSFPLDLRKRFRGSVLR
jgi:hypothetical protein